MKESTKIIVGISAIILVFAIWTLFLGANLSENAIKDVWLRP